VDTVWAEGDKDLKETSAQRQINAAIEHFHKGDFESAITLAAAAQGLIAEGRSPSLFRELVARAKDLDFNLPDFIGRSYNLRL
jgi:hypothetical protein